MTNLRRRLKKLQALLTDASGLTPHSQKWLEYWDRQYHAFMTGGDAGLIRSSTVEVFRAVMKCAEESPASLVGSIPHSD